VELWLGGKGKMTNLALSLCWLDVSQVVRHGLGNTGNFIGS